MDVATFSLSTLRFFQPLLSFNNSHLSPATLYKRTIPSRLRLSAATATAASTTESEIELENRKFELLQTVTDTNRGLTATPLQRSSIEEALVSVESFDALSLLDGTWRLQYTSAPDVLLLFQSAATLPFFEVDQIFQKFECGDRLREGVVRNIVRWSIPRLLEEQEGATLVVSANFSVVSVRNIYLEFEEIAVQNIKISEELQALLAPAILPRSFFSLQILQFIQSFKTLSKTICWWTILPVLSRQKYALGPCCRRWRCIRVH